MLDIQNQKYIIDRNSILMFKSGCPHRHKLNLHNSIKLITLCLCGHSALLHFIQGRRP